MASSLRPDQRVLLGAGGLSVLAWMAEPLRWLVIPFVYLNTHLHELCHALAAVGTGGSVGHIQVFANGSGVTEVFGGQMVLVGSAGYVGAAAIGGGLILLARQPATARQTLTALGVILLVTLAVWIRGDLVGIVSALGWALALGAMAKWGSDRFVQFFVALIGLLQGLTSLQALLELLHLSSAQHGATDAAILARLTGLPPLFWAVGWALLSLVLLGYSLRLAWSGTPIRRSFPR